MTSKERRRTAGPCIPFSVLLLFLLSSVPGAASEPDPTIGACVEAVTAQSLLEHVETLVAFGTRRWDQPGGREAQRHIETFLSGLGLDDVYSQDFDAGTDNVVGVLRGRLRPDRLHVIGAHYDSVGAEGPEGPAPGADDNGSGTAALLEAARVLSGSERRPAETIVFVAFSGEENGLLGSRAFVADLMDRRDEVADMICLDVIGYLEPGLRLDLSVTSTEFDPEIDALIARLGETAATYLPELPFEGGPGCG